MMLPKVQDNKHIMWMLFQIVEKLGKTYTEKVEHNHLMLFPMKSWYACIYMQVVDDEKELLQNEEEADSNDVKKKKKYLGSIKYKVNLKLFLHQIYWDFFSFSLISMNRFDWNERSLC